MRYSQLDSVESEFESALNRHTYRTLALAICDGEAIIARLMTKLKQITEHLFTKRMFPFHGVYNFALGASCVEFLICYIDKVDIGWFGSLRKNN